jgi:hypothetical protein
MLDPTEGEEPPGKLDAVALLYIATGVPGIFGFIILLFVAVKIWNIPA